ncbi:MAG: TonB-dependent receptor [Opitutaceae bacterium]|nr:TonB-dependent receptor [Opitutaceae bacterium]
MNSTAPAFRRRWAHLAWLATLSTVAMAQTVATQTKPAAAATEEKKTVATETLSPAMKLEEVQVTGSRIRQTEIEGPSPVIQYDRRYIDSTGAMNLSDFLNYLPQNYSGISSGRGSTPNELNPEFGQRTESTTPLISTVTGAASAPPGQTGVSGVSLRGLGSGSTLVLVDGRRMVQSGVGNKSSDSRQGFVDLNGIPLGMVERIEVITDGASAIYGADAVAGVVNIILKKNWTGSELSGGYKGAFHGGGHERMATLTTGFAKGKLQGVVSVDYYSRADLKASQRAFSKNQDHRGITAGTLVATGAPFQGRDLRINFGYPGVVQARTGNLTGFTLSDGTAARFAVVNAGITGNPTLSNFVAAAPSSTNNAVGIVRGNTSSYLDIIPESERYGFSGSATYRLSDRLEFYARGTFADVRGIFYTQPPVSSASATSGFGAFATIVPAVINGVPNVYNPFGQDVLVGLINDEFGSESQTTRTQTHRGLVGARGNWGETWRWDAAISLQRYAKDETTRLFNGAAITAALANPDLSLRLNPFLDSRVAGRRQGAIYESMARYNENDSSSWSRSFDVTVDGSLYELPGGSLKVAAGGVLNQDSNKNYTVNVSEAVVPVTTRQTIWGSEDSESVFAEFYVPVVGKQNAIPLVRRLDLQLAGRYENFPAYSKFIPKYGASWTPIPSVLVRASYGEGFRAPSLTEYQVATSTSTATVVDPRRTPASTTGVVVTRGSRPNVGPETSTNNFYGIVFEPPFAKGLNLQVNYYDTEQKNAVQILSATTIVNNEALFQDRVTRAAPTASDTALGQPGQITAVDLTFINFGLIVNRSLDIGADYTLPWEHFGRWRLGLNASKTLEASRQLAPNQLPVVLEGDTAAPPKWKLLGSIFWDRGPMSASVFINYLDGFNSNNTGNSFAANNTTQTFASTPAVTKVDVRAGYSFRNGVWRGYGRNLRINAGIGNLFDKEPPFSDTVFGYNGGLHSHLVLGRSYELSFVLPF